MGRRVSIISKPTNSTTTSSCVFWWNRKALYDHHREEIQADLNMLAALEELDRFYLYTKLELMSRLVHYQNIAQIFADDPENSND